MGLLASDWLLVRLNVKIDEQTQIACEKKAAKKCRRLRSSAGATIGEPLPVSVSEVGIRAKVDDEKVDDKLDDLHGGQVLLPPYLSSTSSCVVVVIHKDMNAQVERDYNPRHTGLPVELSVAQESSCRVVEDVQKCEGFLLERKEDRVQQLEIFKVIVDNIVKFQSFCPCSSVTNGIEWTMLPCYREDFLQHEGKQKRAARAEDNIMGLE